MLNLLCSWSNGYLLCIYVQYGDYIESIGYIYYTWS